VSRRNWERFPGIIKKGRFVQRGESNTSCDDGFTGVVPLGKKNDLAEKKLGKKKKKRKWGTMTIMEPITLWSS